jgi:hypothetical protein
MRGLDGNYINTQGDALAKMQVAYQAEQNRQQIRAQMEHLDELRKLREQVNETEKENPASGPQEVKDDESSSFRNFSQEKETKKKDSQIVITEKEETPVSKPHSHIDIRV